MTYRYLAALAALLALLATAGLANAATFTVNDTGDASDASAGDGSCATAGAVCTLSACIEEANVLAGDDVCNVGALTITPAAVLPEITTNLVIDGSGAAGATIADILGGTDHTLTAILAGGVGLNYGLRITGGTVTVRGLRVEGFDDASASGISVQGGTVAVESCKVTANENGVALNVGGALTVGGTITGQGNLLADNTVDGVFCSGVSGGIVVLGNVITGNEDGVYLAGCDDAVVGGTTAGARNVISANLHEGVHLDSADGVTIAGNYIGTTRDGLSADGNLQSGIRLDGANDGTVIGGATAAHRNVVSGNAQTGVLLSASTTNTTTRNNYLGLDATGGELCNGGGGYVDAGSANTQADNRFGCRGCCDYPGDSTSPLSGITCVDRAATGGTLNTATDCAAVDAVLDGSDGTHVPDAICDTGQLIGGACLAVDGPPPTPTGTATATATPGGAVPGPLALTPLTRALLAPTPAALTAF